MKRKYIFLAIFIISIMFIFNITDGMLLKGFSDTIGLMQASDRRCALSLISLFCLISYFLEDFFERMSKLK